MNYRNAKIGRMARMAMYEIAQVSGGVVEKEGLYPRKFGDIDYQVYVDGMYWDTTYAAHGATITGNRTDPLIHE
jgi:hypothetical protein